MSNSRRWTDQYPPREPEVKRVRVATGLDYHVLEWDPGPAVDHSVVLVHGFLDLGRSWQPVVEAGFGAGLHLLAPDMRGHGHSDRVGRGGYYHFMDYLADLRSLIEQHGRRRVSLVGHSMGGSIASYYAGAFNSHVEKLALLEGLGPPEDTTPVPDRVVSWVSAWQRQTAAEPKHYQDAEEAAKRLTRLDPLLAPELALWLVHHSTRRTENGGVQFLHDPLHLTTGPYPFRVEVARSFWERVRCPVLLVEGAESVFRHAGPEGNARRAHFAQVSDVVLPGAGHMMMRHQPAALAEVLQGFFTG